MDTLRAVIYARYSKGDLTERIDSQVKRCRAECDRRGYVVVEVITEDEASASEYAKGSRLGYADAIAMLADDRADALVAWHLDRIWRRPSELEALIELGNHGKSIVTLNGEYDLTNSDQRLNLRMGVIVAAKASEDSSRRIRAKHEDIAMAGRFAGGKRPFGYDIDKDGPGGLRLRDDEATQIRRWVEILTAGGGLADCVDAATVPPVIAGEWSVSSVRGILMADRLSAVRTHTITDPKNPRRRVQAGSYQATWEPILTVDEQATVKRLISLRGGSRRPTEQWRHYMLSGGLAVCGACGTKLSASGGSNGQKRYNCLSNIGGCGSLSVSAARLEETVEEMVFHAAETSIPVAFQQTHDPADDQAQLSELMEDYASKLITRDEWQTARKIITDRMREGERRSQSDPLAPYRQPDALRNAWPTMSNGARRVVLDALLAAVVVEQRGPTGRRFDKSRVMPRWRE